MLCKPDKGCGHLPWQFRMVMNHLKDANIHCRRAASKESLTDGQAVDCLAFITGWRDFDWGSVIFTNETSISSDCYSRGHVYHEPDMTLAISNDVRDRDDLAHHAGAGCLVLALAC